MQNSSLFKAAIYKLNAYKNTEFGRHEFPILSNALKQDMYFVFYLKWISWTAVIPQYTFLCVHLFLSHRSVCNFYTEPCSLFHTHFLCFFNFKFIFIFLISWLMKIFTFIIIYFCCLSFVGRYYFLLHVLCDISVNYFFFSNYSLIKYCLLLSFLCVLDIYSFKADEFLRTFFLFFIHLILIYTFYFYSLITYKSLSDYLKLRCVKN